MYSHFPVKAEVFHGFVKFYKDAPYNTNLIFFHLVNLPQATYSLTFSRMLSLLQSYRARSAAVAQW